MPQGKLVLLVDDQPADYGFYKRVLRENGWTVILAESTQEAESIIDMTNPEISLFWIDLKFEEIHSGFGLSKIIRRKYKSVPIVFCSILNDPDTSSWAKQFMPYVYINKPVSAARISDALNKLFQQ